MGGSGDTAPTGDERVPADGGQSDRGDATPEAAQQKRLSPAAQAAIARYRRLMGNVSGADRADEAPEGGRSDLDRHLADRPPHWAPPRRERP